MIPFLMNDLKYLLSDQQTAEITCLFSQNVS